MSKQEKLKTRHKSNSIPKGGTKAKHGTHDTATNLIAATGGLKPIYQQVDKIEFYLPTDAITDKDVALKSHMVCLPLTDSQANLRVAKIRSVKVHIWNRGPHDLYLEVMQPFGAHDKPTEIVAWGPVKGRRGRPQTKWTVKANKSGGMFNIDVSDNSITLPATQNVKGKDGTVDVEKYCMLLFGFAVTRNKVSFTGQSGNSSRALQIKVVADYVGPENDDSAKTFLLQGEYSDLGKVVKYPVPMVIDVFKQMGLIPLDKIMGREVMHPFHAKLNLNQDTLDITVDDKGRAYQGWSGRQLTALRVSEQDMEVLKNKGYDVLNFPLQVTPSPVMLLKMPEPKMKFCSVGPAVANLIVSGRQLPAHLTEALDDKDAWYFAAEYYQPASKDLEYALAVAVEPNIVKEGRDFIDKQYSFQTPSFQLNGLVPYVDKTYVMERHYSKLFKSSRNLRPVIQHRGELRNLKAFSIVSLISMVTVIIKVVEAAYAAYNQYAPQKYEGALPGHAVYKEEDGFSVIGVEETDIN